MSDERHAAPAPWLIGLRLAVGLAQGLALYLLYSAYDAKSWPATDANLLGPLVFMAVFVPLILIQGAGNLRARTLIFWTLAAAAIVAGLAWYNVWRAWPVEYIWSNGGYRPQAHFLPSFGFFVLVTAGVFIAHALISGGDADRRLMATYPTHFDVAWKLGVQVALAAAFVAAFWLVLWLGAGLFNLIKLDFFEELIEHRWFAIPATALATAASLHVSDVRAGLVRGIRTLALVLLSWLLPLMSLIAAAFLASLVFTGLATLWATHYATALLLTAAGVLVVLINAAYQDGHEERKASLFFALSIRFASLLLVPIVTLAAYALWLRVDQYGWSADRVSSAACILVASSYALGYALGAVLPGLRLIERWNFVTALLILGVLAALSTPLAEPARLAVADQMARLKAGKVTPAKFDADYLRWEGGRYGRAALKELADGSADKALRKRAGGLLDAPTRYAVRTAQPPKDVQASMTVFPKGKKLPAGFVESALKGDIKSPFVSSFCLRDPGCTAILLDFDGDGRDEVLLGDGVSRSIYHQGADGLWRMVAAMNLPYGCDALEAALKSGQVSWAAPQPRPWRDIEFGGRRFAPDMSGDVPPECDPKKAPSSTAPRN